MCVLTSVEPCRTFEIYRNRETKHLQLQPRIRNCLFLHHYLVHPVFGFLNARIQTWFPFSIQIGLNGTEWLAHQMDQAWPRLCAARQLLSLDRGLASRTTADGSAAQCRVAHLAERHRGNLEPDP
jgi:hypothetical protein